MSHIEPLSPDHITLLKKFDTPTICNIIEVFDVRPRNRGYMDGRIVCNFPQFPPMVGYAATATFRSADEPRGDDVYAGMDGHLQSIQQLPEPRVVVFQDLDEPSAAATFGEVMCTSYKTFGCSGLITSGAGRDIDQVEAIEFPVFTGSTICAHGYCHILHTDLPVHVGGLTVYPGDLLHGDRNGVTNIPHEIAQQVAEIGDEFVAAEEVILNTLREKGADIEAYGEARNECVARIQELGKRVQK